jgi:hypothetical protein
LFLLAPSSFAASSTATAATKKKEASTKKAAASKKNETAKPRVSAVNQTSKKKTATISSRSRRPARKGPVGAASRSQLTPTPERYKQIQEALAAKGYLSPDQVNGQWSDASIDALKRFQAAQNIDSSGKINSLSLIALGLGPRHDAPSAPAATSPATAPQATPAPAAP